MLLTQLPLLFQLASAPAPVHFLPGMAYGPPSPSADSILETEATKAAANIRRMTIAPLIGEAIARTASEQSVSSLFD